MRHNRTGLIVLGLLLLAVLAGLGAYFAAPRAAAQLWVKAGGSGSSCTQAAPCGTIAAASNAAQAGDTVNVVGTLALAAFTTTRAGIVYRCTDSAGQYARGSCKIQPANGSSDESTLWTNYGQNVVIKGFEIDGRTPDGRTSARVISYSTPTGTGPVVYSENHVHHGYWRGCTSGGAGLLSDAYTTANAVVNFENNYVHHIGQAHCNQVHGIYMSTNGYVRNNIANDNGGWGIQSWHDAKQNDIDNNIACGNKSGNISVGTGDYYHAAQPWTGAVRNNIVCNAPYGINVYGDIASGQPFSNNLAYNNQTNWNLKNQTCTGCVTGDPKFAGADDFHLQAGSPAIDQGVAVASVTTDMDGVARPQGSAYDIGAYEYGSSTPPPIPAATGNAALVFIPAKSCNGLPSGALYADGNTVRTCP